MQPPYTAQTTATAHRNKENSRRLIGAGLIIFGVYLALHKLNVLPDFFEHVRFWPILLIGIGLAIGIKHRFTKIGAWILILIGTANLIDVFEIGNTGVSSREIFFPAAIVIIGLVFILRPKGRHHFPGSNRTAYTPHAGSDAKDSIASSWTPHTTLNPATDSAISVINANAVFGGRKETVLSKNFQGGSASAVFGGVEINLMQAATLQQTIVLDLTVAFGGIELIIPSNWNVSVEITPILGGVNDSRNIRATAEGATGPLLVLKGTCILGGVEIKSY